MEMKHINIQKELLTGIQEAFKEDDDVKIMEVDEIEFTYRRVLNFIDGPLKDKELSVSKFREELNKKFNKSYDLLTIKSYIALILMCMKENKKMNQLRN